MASNQPGPYLPSESIASQLEQTKVEPKELKKSYVDANPGPIILSEEQSSKLEAPKSKEDLKKRAEAMNQGQ